MVAGPNGSGKTTLVQALQARGIDFGEYINPDDIADGLTGSYDERVAQAQLIADDRRNACIEARRSFSFETVMSHPSKLDILVRAKEAGFFVQLFFVGIDDPNTNVERVALRVAQGGHSVPEDKIRSRWKRTMEQLHEAIRSTDEAFVFDNSAAGTIDSAPRLVFRRSFIQKRNLPRHEQYPPIPTWVRHYVLGPLGIDSPSGYSSFGPGRPLRSIVTAQDEPVAPKFAPQFVSTFRASPHDLEAEQRILGSILLNNDFFYSIGDFLSPAEFYEPIHQKIFELASDLIRAGKVASPSILKSMFPIDIDIGGMTAGQYLARLAAEATVGTDTVQLGRIVSNLAIRRSLISIGDDLLSSAYDAPHDLDVRQIFEQTERRLYDLAEPARYDSDGLQKFSHALVSAIDSLAGAFISDNGMSGVVAGLTDLDRVTRGFQKTDLVIIGGQSGMGTTSLAANIAYNVAKAWRGEVSADGSVKTLDGGIVGFFSLDMSAERLASRIIAGRSGIPTNLISRGGIGESDFDRIATIAREIQTIPLYIDDTGALSTTLIAARARRLKRRRGLDLLLIDNILGVQTSVQTEGGEEQELVDVAANLKLLAEELGIPILLVTPLRSTSTRQRPDLPALRELGLLDRFADLVLLIFREEFFLINEEPVPGTNAYLQWISDVEAAHGLAELIIAKNRRGLLGSITVNFSPPTGWFSDLPNS
jgi:replicative DNA helicase